MDNPSEHKAQKKREYYAKGKNTAGEQGTNVPKGWKPTAQHPLPPFRCTGIVKNGERKGLRCDKWAIEGMAESNAKCVFHGAQLPKVKEKAAERIAKARRELLGLAPSAVDVINDIMISGDNDSVRLKAAQDVLDRTGILKGQEINLDVKTHDSAAEEIRLKLEEMRKSITSSVDPDIEVEEVIEDEDPS